MENEQDTVHIIYNNSVRARPSIIMFYLHVKAYAAHSSSDPAKSSSTTRRLYRQLGPSLKMGNLPLGIRLKSTSIRRRFLDWTEHLASAPLHQVKGALTLLDFAIIRSCCSDDCCFGGREFDA
jgi:hypothetical protein